MTSLSDPKKKNPYFTWGGYRSTWMGYVLINFSQTNHFGLEELEYRLISK